ncbi:PEGA domain-containing protein [Candidatus Woesearchaeota archaeon]|nr:PEGA domain-containing protein [Candidatus Woesearchaeota archaeon]
MKMDKSGILCLSIITGILLIAVLPATNAYIGCTSDRTVGCDDAACARGAAQKACTYECTSCGEVTSGACGGGCPCTWQGMQDCGNAPGGGSSSGGGGQAARVVGDIVSPDNKIYQKTGTNCPNNINSDTIKINEGATESTWGCNPNAYYAVSTSTGTKTITLTPPQGLDCDRWALTYHINGQDQAGGTGTGCSAQINVQPGDWTNHLWFYLKPICTPSPEICDGVDNNCNGLVDEGFDNDGDGFSTCGTKTTQCCSAIGCQPGTGTDNRCEDCNDDPTTGGADIHPGAQERCDGVDRNCNGQPYDGVDPDTCRQSCEAGYTQAPGVLGSDAYSFTGTDGKTYLVQMMINNAGTTSWDRKAPYEPASANGIDWGARTQWEAVDLTNVNAAPNIPDPAFAGACSFMYTGTDNKLYFAQTIIHSDGKRAWSRKCEVNPGAQNAKYGVDFTTCSQWGPYDLSNEPIPNVAKADRAFADCDIMTFTDSGNVPRYVRSLIHKDGRRSWNEVCRMDPAKQYGVDFTTCTQYRYVDLGQEKANPTDPKFVGLHSYTYTSSTDNKKYVVQSLTHADGQRGWWRKCPSDPAAVNGVNFQAGNPVCGDQWTLVPFTGIESAPPQGSAGTASAQGITGAVVSTTTATVRVHFSSIPGAANVYVDATSVGSTNDPGDSTTLPLMLDIPAGTHTIKFSKSGYNDYTTTITVTEGSGLQEVAATLTPLVPPGSIQVDTAPQGANVYIGGSLKGTTPTTITDLVPGTYTLSIIKAGYYTQTRTATADSGGTAAVSATLAPSGSPIPDQMPKGNVETADCNTITGWACDQDLPDQQIQVDFWTDQGIAGSAQANLPSIDAVKAACGGRSNAHGFSFDVPTYLSDRTTLLKDGNSHAIRAMGININPNSAQPGNRYDAGGHPELTNSPKTITCTSHDTIGYMETANCNTITGWSCDQDRPDQQIQVDFWEVIQSPTGTTRQIIGSTPANLPSIDAVKAACGGTSNAHGYTFTIPSNLRTGTHAIEAYGINIDQNGNRMPAGNTRLVNSPKTITCTAPPQPNAGNRWIRDACCGDDPNENVKQSYDGCNTGCCPANKCYEPATNACIASGYSSGRRLCYNGEWTDRSNILAILLRDYSAQEGFTDSSIYCGTYQEALNRYNYPILQKIAEDYFKGTCHLGGTPNTPCSNDVCVMEYAPGKVILGGSLNIEPGSTTFGDMLTFSGDCSYAMAATDGQIKQCNTNSKKLWYNKNSRVFLYSSEDINLRAGDWTSIVQRANAMPKGQEISLPVPETKTVDKLYWASKGHKGVIGDVGSGCASDLVNYEYLYAKYTGFSTDICSSASYLNEGECNLNSGEYEISAARRKDESSRVFDAWQDLTSKLRINPARTTT